jgi:hypothetical protein
MTNKSIHGEIPQVPWIVLLSCALVLPTANADPSISVVEDSKGSIYYSDLKSVWKVDRDGSRRVAVPNVHTHENISRTTEIEPTRGDIESGGFPKRGCCPT